MGAFSVRFGAGPRGAKVFRGISSFGGISWGWGLKEEPIRGNYPLVRGGYSARLHRVHTPAIACTRPPPPDIACTRLPSGAHDLHRLTLRAHVRHRVHPTTTVRHCVHMSAIACTRPLTHSHARSRSHARPCTHTRSHARTSPLFTLTCHSLGSSVRLTGHS